MTIDSETTALILDRTSALIPDQAKILVQSMTGLGNIRPLIFPFEVDLPDNDPHGGLVIHAEEIAALSRLSAVVDGVAGAEWRTEDRATLELLIARAREAL